MNDHEKSMVLDLIFAYQELVSELEEVYYLQDGAKIDAANETIDACEKKLGITWKDGVPWFEDGRELRFDDRVGL